MDPEELAVVLLRAESEHWLGVLWTEAEQEVGLLRVEVGEELHPRIESEAAAGFYRLAAWLLMRADSEQFGLQSADHFPPGLLEMGAMDLDLSKVRMGPKVRMGLCALPEPMSLVWTDRMGLGLLVVEMGLCVLPKPMGLLRAD